MASLTPKSDATPLGHRLAAHLLRRTTYAVTKANVDSFATKTVSQAMTELFTPKAPTLPEPLDPYTGQHWINQGTTPVSASFHLNRYIKAWWLQEAMQDLSIAHKMQFFLHTIFTISIFDEHSERFYDYIKLLEFYQLGSFQEFAKKMTLDNLMCDYLDNEVNFGFNPNENYAREFLELFTIGKGAQIAPDNYTTFTEHDVQQATRTISGWRRGTRTNSAHNDPDTGLSRNYAEHSFHDKNDKTFSSAFDTTTIVGATLESDMYRELSDFVDMIFTKIAVAENFCRKLYRFFVSNNITTEIETDIIQPLAQTFFNSNYNIQTTVEQLLKSQHFYDEDDSDNSDEIIGGLVKAPHDMVTHALAFFDMPIPDPVTNYLYHYTEFYHKWILDDVFEKSGFNLFSPTEVAGYPAYHQAPAYSQNWFHSGSIIARYKFAETLLTGWRVLSTGFNGSALDIVDFVHNSGNFSNPADGTVLVQEMLAYLLCETPDTDRFNYFLNTVFLDNLSLINWQFEWQNYLNTAGKSAVKIPLEALVKAILQSPEFQVF